MHSIKTKLTLWLITGIMIILGITGYASYSTDKERDESEYRALRKTLTERLALSLPYIVWQLDDHSIELTLDAELGWQPVMAIRVEGEAGLNIGRIRHSNGIRNIREGETPSADEIVTLPIIYQGKEKLGVATVYLSRQELESEQHYRLLEIALQIILLDLLSFILMTYALRHFVFTPLNKLQKVLNFAASSDNISNITLNFNQNNELGEVAKGFNRIVDRIKADLVMRTAAEETAKQEKQKAQEAYNRLLEAQQTLVESEKLASLGGLVAGVAHEINTPVGITLTTASHLATVTHALFENLKNGLVKKSDFRNYLTNTTECCNLILSNAERAANLINSFKQVAVDQTSEARRDFQLEEYLQEIITSLKPKFKRSQVQVTIECKENLLMDSYPGALSQVITNLAINATVHAFQEQGPQARNHLITIVARQQPDGIIQLVFEDNGQGIAPENLNKIFQPFYTTKRGSGGSGLGLHIVYNIVRQRLGGTIEVKSQLGEGTTFFINIPQVAPESQPKEKM